jgi:gamma-glutamylcyclotransferase (GGCT)/AIG2-like uncharacterized protein YtfP
MTNQIFVYGSLRKGFESPAYGYISQYFDLVDHGKIAGLLYDLGDYPAAKPADGDQMIVGELYRIREDDELDWALAQLDDYEGVDASYDEPSCYERKISKVFLNNGEVQDAWVYWYCGDVKGKPLVQSGDVLEYLRQKLGK